MVFYQPGMIGQLIGEGARRVVNGLHPGRLWHALNQSSPGELIMVPQDLRTADPVLAQEFYNGIYAFAGGRIDTGGENPFSNQICDQIKNEDWKRELHSFKWLRHLHSSQSMISNNHAGSLVRDWISHVGKSRSGVAWHPQIAAQRLISWLCHSVIIVDQEDIKFYNQFMKMIGAHISYLQSKARENSDGFGGLQVHIALAYAALCVKYRRPAKGARARKPHEELGRIINQQIYSDGGHVSRCPSLLPEILVDLLPLRQAYERLGIAPPVELLNAIDRIMPAIRYYRHRDGSFARFNGVGVSERDLIATVLRYDDAMGEPTQEASQSGYQRLTGGPTTVIMDAGNPPKGNNSINAHAGCLSFEMSSVRTCFIVNGGAPQIGDKKMIAAARSSAAHSTAIIHNTSSCKFHHGSAFKRYLGGRVISGPTRVASERKKIPGYSQVIARHDGYLRQFGVWHERVLQLSDDGNMLFGRERFYVNGGNPPTHLTQDDCAIRFHLHPGVRPHIDHENGVINIVASDNQSWQFSCDKGKVSIEESIFFAGSGGSVATAQIVINLELSKNHECGWRFEQTIGTRPHPV